MEQIAKLLSGNLSYISGENGNGLNGAKAEFTNYIYMKTERSAAYEIIHWT